MSSLNIYLEKNISLLQTQLSNPYLYVDLNLQYFKFRFFDSLKYLRSTTLGCKDYREIPNLRKLDIFKGYINC